MAVTYEKTFEIEIINELSASVYKPTYLDPQNDKEAEEQEQFIQETLNKLAERPKTDTQLDLFSYDTG
ncbi:TPA: hypothetical protein ACGOSV_002172 [Streptococcus suis]